MLDRNPYHSQQKKTNHFCTVVLKKSDNNLKREKEVERLYACQNGLCPPHLKQSLDPLSFSLTNGCCLYLGGEGNSFTTFHKNRKTSA